MLAPIITSALVPLLIAMFLAVNMGGSGTAPSFATAYGANLIRRDLIPGLFGIMVFVGALLAGRRVSLTLGNDILPSALMTLTLTSIVLLSVALSLLFANLAGIPQSTAQSTVFALMAPAVYFNAFSSHKVFTQIIPTWFILPIIAFSITYLAGRYIYLPLRNSNKIDFHKWSQHGNLKWIVIATSCYVAFSIGASNVGNAAGPIASMMMNQLHTQSEESFKLILAVSVLVIAPCFAIGSSIFGHKLLKTAGKDIVHIGPIGASIASFLTATLLLAASMRGLPTSLVQLNMAVIIAIAILKKGTRNVWQDPTVRKFWVVWIAAPAFAFGIAYLLTYLVDLVGITNP